MSAEGKFVEFGTYTIRVDHISAVSEVINSGMVGSIQYQVNIIVSGYPMTQHFANENDAYEAAEIIASAMGI